MEWEIYMTRRTHACVLRRDGVCVVWERWDGNGMADSDFATDGYNYYSATITTEEE
jgi:hypothetical protein